MSFTHQHPCLADDVRVTAADRNMSIWVDSWFSQQEAGKNKYKINLLFTINCFYYSSEHQASHKSQSNIFLILNFYFLLFISCSASRYFSLLITLFVDRNCTDIEKLFLLIFSKNIIKWRQNTLLIPISHISCQNCFRLVRVNMWFTFMLTQESKSVWELNVYFNLHLIYWLKLEYMQTTNLSTVQKARNMSWRTRNTWLMGDSQGNLYNLQGRARLAGGWPF